MVTENTDNDDAIEIEKPIRKKSTQLKKRLLKKEHTHGRTVYPVGTPLENLKPSDSTIEFLEKRDII